MSDRGRKFTLEIGYMLTERYRVDEVLSSNGICITYRAYDTLREKKIILKELYPKSVVERSHDDKVFVNCIKLVDEPSFQQMKEHMVKEAKTLIKLYPLKGISNALQYLEENGTVYIVLDFIEGTPILEVMQRDNRKQYLLSQLLLMLKPMMESLEKLHKKGVVHGKINPSLLYMNSNQELVLLGFGDPMQDAAMAITKEEVARVPGYAAVELYIENGGYGSGTDIYALAAVIYELTTKHSVPPFYERINELENHDKDLLEPPILYNNFMMDYQNDALLKALSIHHFDRYASMKEFMKDISDEEFASDKGVIHQRYKPQKFLEKQRYYKYYGLALLLAVVVIFGFFGTKFGYFLNGQRAKQFYLELQESEVSKQCEMIVELSGFERSNLANDYSTLEEGEDEIRYYDMVKKRFVTHDEIGFDWEKVSFVCLDYRVNNCAVMTLQEDHKTIIREFYLIPDVYGKYSVTTDVYENNEKVDHSKQMIALQ